MGPMPAATLMATWICTVNPPLRQRRLAPSTTLLGSNQPACCRRAVTLLDGPPRRPWGGSSVGPCSRWRLGGSLLLHRLLKAGQGCVGVAWLAKVAAIAAVCHWCRCVYIGTPSPTMLCNAPSTLNMLWLRRVATIAVPPPRATCWPDPAHPSLQFYCRLTARPIQGDCDPLAVRCVGGSRPLLARL